MTLDFFQLKEEPFAAPPNPRFLYLSATHREALASLLRTLQADRGLVTLVAEPGLGKTTLLFHILNTFGEKVETVYILQAAQTPTELLQSILADLGVRQVDKNLDEMVSQLKKSVTEEQRQGKRVVIVIDDAQNLDPAVFHLLRKVSGFETSQGRLAQFVLCGLPILSDKLATIKPLREIQREAPIARLEPLSAREIALYLDHRLRTAGYARQTPLFTFEASSLVARYTQGNPRIINRLCTEALSMACMEKREQIGVETVQEAAANLKLIKPKQENSSWKPAQAPSATPVFSQAEPLRQGSDIDRELPTQSAEELPASELPSSETAELASPAQIRTQVPALLESTVLFNTSEVPELTETPAGNKPLSVSTAVSPDERPPLSPEAASVVEAPSRADDLQEEAVQAAAQCNAANKVADKAGVEGEIVLPKIRQTPARKTPAPPTLVSDEKSVALSQWNRALRKRKTGASRPRARKKVPAPTRLAPRNTAAGSSPWWLAPAPQTSDRPIGSAAPLAPAFSVSKKPISVPDIPMAQPEPVPSLPEKAQGDFRPRWFPQSASPGSKGIGGIARRALLSRPFAGSGIAALFVIAASGIVFSMTSSKTDRTRSQVDAASSLQPSATRIQPDVAMETAHTTMAAQPKAKPSAISPDADAAVKPSAAKDLKGMDLESALQALSTQKLREQQEQERKARATE